ncbi:MAG TPA: arsenic resistance N-acetyltransferase ArsN2 [Gemmatimonadales bacterium]|jgi:amino-acid N-acetyltransferase
MSPVVRAASAADFEQVVRLLVAADLPTAGLERSLPDFLVAEEDGRILGAAGLEVYGAAALLRSAVVDASRRGSGLGNGLVSDLLVHAGRRGVREVYLLTTTADAYFPRFGFTRVARDEVAPAVRESEEFRGACPDTAVAMHKTLT